MTNSQHNDSATKSLENMVYTGELKVMKRDSLCQDLPKWGSREGIARGS